tara:strand:+ start:42438 stop:42674 length:237 start_codon:yes stop_codon:yes gene_type:complete
MGWCDLRRTLHRGRHGYVNGRAPRARHDRGCGHGHSMSRLRYVHDGGDGLVRYPSSIAVHRRLCLFQQEAWWTLINVF